MSNKDSLRNEMMFWLCVAEKYRNLGYERKAKMYEKHAEYYSNQLSRICAYCDSPATHKALRANVCLRCALEIS